MSAGPIPAQDGILPTRPNDPPAAVPAGTPTQESPDQPVEPAAAPATATAGSTASTDTLASSATAVEPASVPVSPVASATRRLKAVAVARRVLSFALMTGLVVLGIAIGYTAFVVDRPLPPVVGDAATRDVPTPPSIQELVVAIKLNDADAIRAALDDEPYKQYTAELQNWNYQEVTSVETLSTFADGPRTATQLVLVGTSTDKLPVTINLTVLTLDGTIVVLR